MREALVEFFASGQFPHVDVSDRRADQPISIETIFRALDLVPTPILVGMNPASSDIRSNAAGHALFGGGDRNLSQSADEPDRPDFKVYSNGKLVAADDLPMQKAGHTGQPIYSPECELRFDDGSVKYIRGKAVPVFGKNGTIRGTIGVFLDITEARETEIQLALMSEEVKHRAKNTLALVSSIARQTLKSKLDFVDYNEFEQRLKVIGQSLDVMTATDGPARTVQDVLGATTQRQLGREKARVKFSGPETPIPLQTLAPLSMAIHELTTNSCKYGALSVASGAVSVTWFRTENPDVLAIDWIESGGPKVIPPTRKGFGSRLLERVLGSPAGKKSKIAYSEHGVECRLYVALT